MSSDLVVQINALASPAIRRKHGRRLKGRAPPMSRAERLAHRRLGYPREQAAARIARRRLKVAAMTAYGSDGARCKCGDDNLDRLQIHHVDGNGSAHRQELFGDYNAAGEPFYRWLRDHGYPPGYETLCWGCHAPDTTPTPGPLRSPGASPTGECTG